MSSERHSRQSFLGPDSEDRIARCTLAFVGLGGGGSHCVQQSAHVGFHRYVLYDHDFVEESNLNRLIGATAIDAKAETPKLHLAKTMIYGLQPQALVKGHACRWQEKPEPLREAQIVIGCVDSYQARNELEIACRRYLMHYVDIGMDVHGSVVAGQVLLSSPGGLCMRCMGFLTYEKLAAEARRYGDAGARPQVVWSNGVLASTAMGLVVDLVTNWTGRRRSHAYLVYDGNECTVTESAMLRNRADHTCPHFPVTDIGDPVPVYL